MEVIPIIWGKQISIVQTIRICLIIDENCVLRFNLCGKCGKTNISNCMRFENAAFTIENVISNKNKHIWLFIGCSYGPQPFRMFIKDYDCAQNYHH